MKLIFQNGHAAQHRRGAEEHARHPADHPLVAELAGRDVHRGCAGALAEADDGHLQQPAAERPAEIGVRFHAIDQHDAVGTQRLGAAKDGHAIPGFADLPDSERGVDGHTHRLLGDAVAGEDFALALGRRPAVAAHRGEDERTRSRTAQQIEQSGDDRGEIRDAAAAHADGDPCAGLDARTQPGELRVERRGNVERRRRREILPHAQNAGKFVHG